MFTNRRELQILQQGVDSWNRWRLNNPELKVSLDRAHLDGMNLRGIDLSEVSLIGASLQGTNLTEANLYHADFTQADLRRTNLTGAQMIWTHFAYANLARANLTNSQLLATEFMETNLYQVDFDGARIGAVRFENTDLSSVNGLESMSHTRPSHIGIDTIFSSGGQIPENFLLEAGVPASLIAQIPSLVGALQPIQFYSCFISYSTADEAFAKRLYARMREENLRVWFAPEDVKGGQKLHEQIESAIQLYDRLLIVLSDNSMRSEWVMTEIRNARRVELEETRRKLFPIRLVDFDSVREWRCFDAETGKDLAVEVREYFVPDFSNWKERDAFEASFSRLLIDLKAEEVRSKAD